MKIRTNFVSNSSSSSFILAYKSGEPCPHCGRSDPDMLDFFNSFPDVNSDSTCLENENVERIIKKLEEDIENNEVFLRSMEHCAENESVWDSPSYTVSHARNNTQESINQVKNLCNKIKEAENDGWKVIEVQISIHDDSTKRIYESAIKNGTVMILHEEDN